MIAEPPPFARPYRRLPEVPGYWDWPSKGSPTQAPKPIDIRTVDRIPCGKGSRQSAPWCRHPVRIERYEHRGMRAATQIAMRSVGGKEARCASRAEAESDPSESGLLRTRPASGARST